MTFHKWQLLHQTSAVDQLGQGYALQSPHHCPEHPEPDCPLRYCGWCCLRVCGCSCLLHSAQLLANSKEKCVAERAVLARRYWLSIESHPKGFFLWSQRLFLACWWGAKAKFRMNDTDSYSFSENTLGDFLSTCWIWDIPMILQVGNTYIYKNNLTISTKSFKMINFISECLSNEINLIKK